MTEPFGRIHLIAVRYLRTFHRPMIRRFLNHVNFMLVKINQYVKSTYQIQGKSFCIAAMRCGLCGYYVGASCEGRKDHSPNWSAANKQPPYGRALADAYAPSP